MHLLAVVLEGFYAAVASAGGDDPLLVYQGRKVLDANTKARERGVRVGMPLAEAKSILAQEGQAVEWEEEPYREAQRKWLGTVARYSDVVEPLRQHECLADLSGHPRPREAAAQMEADLRRSGLSPRLGLARCRWVARLAARRGDPLGLAHTDASSYVADVPVSSLPIEPEQAKHLHLLGYRTASDVATLGGTTLLAQFGAGAVNVAQSAKGGGDSRVRPLFPEACVAARFVYDGIPETREALDAGLRRVAGEVGAALQSGDLSGKRVELFLEREDASVERLSRTFSRSLATERDVRVALSLLLPEGLSDRIESLRVRLPNLKATRRVQLDVEGGRSREDQAESVKIALQHVRGTFGDAAVRLASDLPEPRWVKVRRAYMEANGHLWT